MLASLHKLCIVAFLLGTVTADIYLHNPRGSNNRLDEAGRDRNNANRMFDSQNNNRGGYNVGSLYYLSGSKLQIEWTNQHSCNDDVANCEIILQYMCDDLIRDGSDTRQIPENDALCEGDCDHDFRFGMNENQDSYKSCKNRARNKGLFTADQNLGPTAISTRQNPNGQRRGLECPEERDYYPYWHPSKWIDIAILTNDPKKCDFFKKESENIKSRFYCSAPTEFKGIIPNTELECLKIKKNNETAAWKESKAHKVAAPICQQTEFTRDNHLGNTKGETPPSFEWTLPDVNYEKCVLRARYNVSTNDYDSVMNNEQVDLSKKIGLTKQEAQQRGYLFKTNPSVKLFNDLDFELNLAINTQQYGRVFQDRSHSFAIRKRPSELESANIVNLNVRGKRGNIVQVYPAVEYDFIPNKLEITKNDYVHIQWTGSNTNPNNNDGQGLAGSDRSNMLLLDNQVYFKNETNSYSPLSLNGDYGRNYPVHLDTNDFLGFSKIDRIKLGILNQYGGNMDELDDAGTYFDLGPKKATKSGVFHYMSSRNNNFSNRDQKGVVIVYENDFVNEVFDYNGGVIQNNNFMMTIPRGCFDELTNVRVDIKSKQQLLNDLSKTNDNIEIVQAFDMSDLASNFIILQFSNKAALPIKVKMILKTEPRTMSSTNIYRISNDYSVSTKLNIEDNDKKSITFMTFDSGAYVAKHESDYSILIGSLIGVTLFIIVVFVAGFFLYRNPKYLERIRYSTANAKRSVLSKI